MSESVRFFGKKHELPSTQGWKFEQRPGGWVIAERMLDDGSIERRRFSLVERRGKVSANLSGRLWSGDVVVAARGASASGGDSDLTAQFPGKVRKVLVQAGTEVAEGDPLLLIEAMKMEFSIKAPRKGRVKAVLVKEAQQLSPGDRLVDLE